MSYYNYSNCFKGIFFVDLGGMNWKVSIRIKACDYKMYWWNLEQFIIIPIWFYETEKNISDFCMWSTGDRVKDDVTGYSEFCLFVYLFVCFCCHAIVCVWGGILIQRGSALFVVCQCVMPHCFRLVIFLTVIFLPVREAIWPQLITFRTSAWNLTHL